MEKTFSPAGIEWDEASARSPWRARPGRLLRDRASAIGLLVVMIVVMMALVPGLIAHNDPTQQFLVLRRQAPSVAHPFGMDELGRDIFSRIVYGARFTLGAGTLAVAFGILAGVPIGLATGYYGGLLDNFLMRAIDAVLSFPYFLIAVMLAAVLGAGFLSAVLAVGITMVPSFARVVRGSVLSMRHNDYILSAVALGCSSRRIVWAHVLPNTLAPLIVLATLNLATGILVVAGLGFLGLGLQPPTPEWGLMLSGAKTALTVAPHVMIFPGVAIMLLVTGTNLLGDGLREVLDPSLRT